MIETRPLNGSDLTTEQLEALVVDAANGDPAARERVFGTILGMARNYCRIRLASTNLTKYIEDVVQEICLAALVALPRYSYKGGSFAQVVYGIAAHKVADAYRSGYNGRVVPVDELPETVDHSPGPEPLALAADLKTRVDRLLAVLPAGQRNIVTLRLADDFSAVQVAEMLGVEPRYVRVAHHRALARLRTVINRSVMEAAA